MGKQPQRKTTSKEDVFTFLDYFTGDCWDPKLFYRFRVDKEIDKKKLNGARVILQFLLKYLCA